MSRLHCNRADAARGAGFTLIEMLVSLAMTLLMMGAVVTLFSTITDSVTGSRSVIDMSERLRHVRNVLQSDLEGATATMLPPLRPENDEGYFEYIEGPYTDKDFCGPTSDGMNPNAIGVNTPRSLFGDTDDVLMFTVRSRGEPFVGHFRDSSNNNITIESPVAEVMYYLAVPPSALVVDSLTSSPTRLFSLYRRVLLVKPGLRSLPIFNPAIGDTYWYDYNDLSMHIETPPSGTAVIVPNTLGDLTKPENRFAHYNVGNVFPFTLNDAIGPPTDRPLTSSAYLVPLGKNSAGGPDRTGDDILMNNVLSFDVQIYDPGAPVQVPNLAVGPTDPAWVAPGGAAPAYGAYVDLGYSYNPSPSTVPQPSFNYGNNLPRRLNASYAPFANNLLGFLSMQRDKLPNRKAFSYGANVLVADYNPDPAALPIGNPGMNCYIYDTWSLHYESDGILQNSNLSSTADLATNGLDDTVSGGLGVGLVDDIEEYETLAPYPARMRGIRIIIRAYEPGSQQVREVTVMQDFLPE